MKKRSRQLLREQIRSLPIGQENIAVTDKRLEKSVCGMSPSKDNPEDTRKKRLN